jgi:hypothetical protein
LKRLQEAYASYIGHPDPLMQAANVMAFMIGTNQPFYPIYLAFIVGSGAWRALPLILSMPFFLAVPLLARRSPLAARLLLLVVGIGNIVVAIAMIGSRSGLAALFLPSAALAAAVFRARERVAMLAMVGFAGAGWLFTNGMGPDVFTDAQYASLQRLNAMSAIGLCGFIGIVWANALRQIEGDR